MAGREKTRADDARDLVALRLRQDGHEPSAIGGILGMSAGGVVAITNRIRREDTEARGGQDPGWW